MGELKESASRDYVATHNRTYSDIAAQIGNSLFISPDTGTIW